MAAERHTIHTQHQAPAERPFEFVEVFQPQLELVDEAESEVLQAEQSTEESQAVLEERVAEYFARVKVFEQKADEAEKRLRELPFQPTREVAKKEERTHKTQDPRIPTTMLRSLTAELIAAERVGDKDRYEETTRILENYITQPHTQLTQDEKRATVETYKDIAYSFAREEDKAFNPKVAELKAKIITESVAARLNPKKYAAEIQAYTNRGELTPIAALRAELNAVLLERIKTLYHPLNYTGKKANIMIEAAQSRLLANVALDLANHIQRATQHLEIKGEVTKTIGWIDTFAPGLTTVAVTTGNLLADLRKENRVGKTRRQVLREYWDNRKAKKAANTHTQSPVPTPVIPAAPSAPSIKPPVLTPQGAPKTEIPVEKQQLEQQKVHPGKVTSDESRVERIAPKEPRLIHTVTVLTDVPISNKEPLTSSTPEAKHPGKVPEHFSVERIGRVVVDEVSEPSDSTASSEFDEEAAIAMLRKVLGKE